MITDHYRDKWPSHYFQPVVPLIPVNIPPVVITPDQWAEYQKLKKDAEKYDQRTNQPHCEKEGVNEWEVLIENFLRNKGLL